jgi:ATP-dependent DNA helicase DinG
MNDTEDWAGQALAAFDTVIDAGGLRMRPGQRAMAEHVARTLAAASLGKPDGDAELRRRLAVVQAGTGVGKSLAYLAPAIALARARQTRVVVSTATVALQEQLVNQDLPALARRLPFEFRYALAKGRGRYVCRLKLERWLTDPDAPTDDADDEDDLLADGGGGCGQRGPLGVAAGARAGSGPGALGR